MVEKNPWWRNVDGPFPESYGSIGVKADGGGSMAGQGRVGPMRLHRACNMRDMVALQAAVEAGDNVNEVEAAGNVPLHSCAYEGWVEGAKFLLEKGAKINASNNAGDTPLSWAMAMRHDDMVEFLVSNGAKKDYQGNLIVPEHVDKVKDFYKSDEGRHHPKPSKEFLEWRKQMDEAIEKEQKSLVPGM